jgi:hypothetical protein
MAGSSRHIGVATPSLTTEEEATKLLGVPQDEQPTKLWALVITKVIRDRRLWVNYVSLAVPMKNASLYELP